MPFTKVRLEPVRSAEPPTSSGDRRHQRFQRLLAGLAGGKLRLGLGELRLVGGHRLVPALGQLALPSRARTRRASGAWPGASARRAGRRRRACRPRARARTHPRAPRRADAPSPERAWRPAASAPPSGAPWAAGGAGLGRRAEADDGAAGDQRRLRRISARRTSAAWSCGEVMPVHAPGGPAIGGEALQRVLGRRQCRVAVDRDVSCRPTARSACSASDARRARRPRG